MRLADQGLACAECGTVAPPDARGWRALLSVGDEAAEDVEEVAVYCARCAERVQRLLSQQGCRTRCRT